MEDLKKEFNKIRKVIREQIKKMSLNEYRVDSHYGWRNITNWKGKQYGGPTGWYDNAGEYVSEKNEMKLTEYSKDEKVWDPEQARYSEEGDRSGDFASSWAKRMNEYAKETYDRFLEPGGEYYEQYQAALEMIGNIDMDRSSNTYGRKIEKISDEVVELIHSRGLEADITGEKTGIKGGIVMYEFGVRTLYHNRTMEEGMSDEEWADAKEAERLANHPEKEKIIKIKQMMDKETDDKEQEEWDKGWYGESLKEIASKLGYLKEAPVGKAGAGNPAFKINPSKVPGTAAFDKRAGLTVGGDEKVDEQDLNKIEKGVTAITGGGRRSAGVSDRGDSIRVMFRYMRGEFAPEEWDKILKYLTGMGFEIKDASNYYEANYDREEPAEAVPTIHLKK